MDEITIRNENESANHGVIGAPLVSVVIPFFNDGKYIKETLQSVAEQTYPNVEIILVDDGSTDVDSMRAFNELKMDHLEKIREINSGPSVARNTAIQHARGKYILPLDADDKIAPTYIEKAVRYLEAHCDCGIVYCKANFFGAKTGAWELPAYSLRQMLLDNVIFVTAMFKREDWEFVGGYDSHMHFGVEDYEFWLSILELGRTVYQIPETLFFYRIKPVSRSTKLNDHAAHLIESYDYILQKHKNLYEPYWIDVMAALRAKEIELAYEYGNFKRKIPFYKYVRNLGGARKRKIKRFLGMTRES